MALRSKLALAAFTGVLAFALALTLLLSTRAEGGAPPPELVSVANRGTPVAPTAGVQAVLERTKTADGTLKRLGKESDTTFYSVEDTAERGDCYGVARGVGAAHMLNSLTCGSAFPSVDTPVLDASVYEATSTGARFDQLKGWTVDRVATIELRDKEGRTLAELAPTSNFYYLPREQMPVDGVQLVARDGTGVEIWRIEAS